MRQLLDKIEENSKFIERERNKVSFSLSDEKMIAAWETSVRTKGTPLSTFYENWNKINKIQKRKKVTKNDELAGELPKIKRAKISADAQTAKPGNKGPLVLFPSDDEDEKDHFRTKEDDDAPAPKVAKAKKKEKTKSKSHVKKKYINNDDSVTEDKDDIVQELSVNDW